MFDFLLTPIVFLFAISVLIAVHEFGHFWVARRMGVKVLRFSIGFGKPLWTHIGRDGVEYVVAAIPLGGYVKMLDEREAPVAEAELPLAFNRKPLARRFAVVAAGPIFNLLFAILAYWAMFIHGMPGMRPILGDLDQQGMAYQAGMRSQQEIIAVDGESTPTWSAVLESVLPYALRREPVDITVDDGGARIQYTLPFQQLPAAIEPQALTKSLGLVPYNPPIVPQIAEVQRDTPAERAGLRSGDVVTAIDGVALNDWQVLVDTVRKSEGRRLHFTVRRNGSELGMDITPASVGEGAQRGWRIGASVKPDEALLEKLSGNWQLDPLAAVPAALYKTWDMGTLTLQMMGEMLIGRASTENISGPITIAMYAKSSALAGLSQFLSFLAIVSISLGVLNLLPVPILDGGHLMFYVIEMIRGRPVSERTEALATKVGLSIILLLMTIALYNDMARLVGG